MSLPGNRENARSGHRRRSNAGRKYTKMLKLAVRHGGVRLNDPVFAGLQLGGNQVEDLGNVLANQAQLAAAIGAL